MTSKPIDGIKHWFTLLKKVPDERLILKQLKPKYIQTSKELLLILKKYKDAGVPVPKGFIQMTFDIEGKRKTWEANPIRVATLFKNCEIKSFEQLKNHIPTIVNWLSKGIIDLKLSNLRDFNNRLLNIDEMHPAEGFGVNSFKHFFLTSSMQLNLSKKEQKELKEILKTQMRKHGLNFNKQFGSDKEHNKHFQQIRYLLKKYDVSSRIARLSKDKIKKGYLPLFALRQAAIRYNNRKLANEVIPEEIFNKSKLYFSEGHLSWKEAYEKARKDYVLKNKQ